MSDFKEFLPIIITIIFLIVINFLRKKYNRNNSSTDDTYDWDSDDFDID